MQRSARAGGNAAGAAIVSNAATTSSPWAVLKDADSSSMPMLSMYLPQSGAPQAEWTAALRDLKSSIDDAKP